MATIGLIGCGDAAAVYASAFAALPAHTVAACYDPAAPDRAALLARRCGGRPYATLDGLLQSGVNAAVVCLPYGRAAAAVVRALEGSCHVLCDAPFAADFDEAWRVCSAAARAGRRCMTANSLSLDPALEAARAAGPGRLLSFEAVYTRPPLNALEDEPDAYGALEDLALPMLGALHSLLGEPFTDVFATSASADPAMGGARHDDVHLVLKAESGVTGQLHAAWRPAGQAGCAVRLYGERDMLSLTLSDDMRVPAAIAFLSAIEGGGPSPLDAEEAARAMRVIFQARRSAVEGRRLYARHG